MSTIFSVRFWKRAAERATKTAAQAALLALGGDVINAWHVDWATIAGVGLGGAVLSLLTSLGSSRKGDHESPSLVE